MSFSRFAHRFSRGGVYALFHSLRLKPVFLSSGMLAKIDAFLESERSQSPSPCPTRTEVPPDIADHLAVLKQNKIVVDSAEYDDQTIAYFGDQIELPYIEIAYFILSDRCNFDCSYCFVKRDRPRSYIPQDMPWETALRGLDMFCRLIRQEGGHFDDEKTITLYGGEPLVNSDVLCRLAEAIADRKRSGELPKKLQTAVVTNGSLMTPEIARSLSINGVTAAISVDGDEATTNANRKYVDRRPVHRDILRAVEICRAEGVNLSFSVTLTEQSLNSPQQTMDFMLNKLSAQSLGFNMLLTDKDFTVPDWYDERAAAFMISAYKVFRQRGIVEDRMMRKVKAFVDSKVYCFDCGACGGHQIVIAPDGQVGICHGFLGNRKYFVTDVTNTTFNPRLSPEYLEWNKRSPINMPECQGCSALGICGGGCPLNAYKNSGSIWALDQRFCTHAKATLEWLVWDLYENSTRADLNG